MRRVFSSLLVVLLAAVYLAPQALGVTVESGEGRGAGWKVTVGGSVLAELGPEAVATIPDPCPAEPAACDDSKTAALLDQDLSPTAKVDALRAAADAAKDGGISATLQAEMSAASKIVLTADDWNARGYSRVEGFSALDGAILADLLESEAVSGTRLNGGSLKNAVASGAKVVRLRLAGILTGQTLAPIVAGKVDQELLNVDILGYGTVRIVFWETNWNVDAATAPGNEVWVNTLRITAPDVDIIVGHAEAISNYVPPNQPPVAGDDTATTSPSTPVEIDVLDNDSDPEGDLDPNINVVTGPTNGTVDCSGGTCIYTPNDGFTGDDTFTYEVCDGEGQCDTATVTVTVANQPPVANDDAAETPSGTPVEIDVLDNDSDPEGDLVATIVVVTGPGNGTVDCSGGTCIYTPGAGFVGDDTFTYEVCDGESQCDTATVTVTVTNRPPVADDDEADTLPGTDVEIDVLDNDSDPEGDLSSTITVVDGPDNGNVDCSGGTCIYTPDPGFEGRDDFTYEVCDGEGACDTATVTVRVASPPAPGNNPPIAEDDSATTRRNNPITINVIGNDHDPDDGDSLRPGSLRVLDGPDNGTVTCSGGSCTYTPNTGFTGTDTFTYEVCDQSWECDWATVTVTVNAPPVNQPPTADDDTVTVAPGTPTVIDVINNDDDPENDLDPDSVRVVDGPSNGTADCAAGQCTYTPDEGFTGTDEFTYEVCDGAGKCDQATVVIVVEPTTPDNSPPSAQDDEASTRPGIAVPITVTQNDSDPDGDLDTSSVRVVEGPSNGTVDCFGSVCTYTPDDGFTGTDSFVYEVCDAEGACDTAVVTIVVDEDGSDNVGTGAGDGDGGGNGSGGGSGGPGRGSGNSDGGAGGNPDLVTNPSRPDPGDSSTSFPSATSPPLLPSLGAPGSGLPFTGTPGGYLAIALYLLGAGTLSLIGGRLGSRRSHPKNAEVWGAPPSRPAQPKPARHPEAEVPALVQTEAPEPASSGEATTEQRPAARRKPTAKKTTAKKTTAKKAPVKKTTTKKSTTEAAAKKKAVAKKSAAKKPVAKKSPAKTNVKKTAAKTTIKKTAAKKTTRRATTTKKSTVAKKKPARAATS